MKTLGFVAVAVAGCLALGCPSDDTSSSDDESSTGGDTTAAPTTMSPTTMTTMGADSTSTSTGMPTSTEDTGPDTGSDSGTDTGTGTETGGPTLPEFPGLDPDEYVRVDRKGFPAINTGLNLLGDKDEYNAADPVDDAALEFGMEIFQSLYTLHLGEPGSEVPDNTGLDDDLTALGLTPCNPPLAGGPSTCDDQAAPFGIPDVLKITVDGDDAFPNGRRPAEPVMDIILAILLLEVDLGADPLDPALLTFLDLDGDGTFGPSLNPLENDVPIPGEFPYLAPPHE